MALRDAFYTIYKSKEYRVTRRNGLAHLISNDPNDLNNGFIERKPDESLNPRIFVKTVTPSEIGDIYEISTYALFQGFEFPIKYEENGEYILVSDYNPSVEKLNFIRVDKYEYEKTVKKEELDLIYEKKTLRPNFFK
ncbi:hypothetical protein BWD09_12730 [Neisseria dentiae]|uniref:Uncharacterized protein n=2 Tax=Neisseria dentiae TaxID=194197 RepID=A0A1X3D1S8_9NEIS|nr:hypothetical protein BWD09_12730 [Neisseria dentiae]QMT46543.1 hypothetical protein H3L92_10870 [Neisseria dentiae]STZ50642.1 Uncharacterised protein [Neisseria dentiae]